MKIILEKERPLNWNIYYSQRHWSKRSKDAQYVHSLFYGAKTLYNKDEMHISFPVKITIIAYMTGRCFDADNICSKMYVDGLKGWLLPDDSYKYVESVTTKVVKVKEKPRIEILID